MITKLDIEKFGLFENYKWENEVGKQETFCRLNIIYGRNYSGKTTLSRILKCIEDKQLHDNYSDAKFNIAFTNGANISQNNLQEELQDYKIRVYNSDFVKKNFNWLHNEDGTINPFTILGAKNVEIDNQIKEIETSLGSIEEGKECGLLYQEKQAKETYEQKKTAHDKKEIELNNSLTEQAKKIKNNATIYNVPTYQINTIKKDISNAQQQGELTDDILSEKKKLLKEEPKETLTTLQEAKLQFEAYYNQVNELLKKQIKPSEPIQELINDSLLQEWVRQGIDKHKNKRATCAFCGSQIDKSLWDKLDAHFSKESEELRQELKTKKDQLEQAKKNLSNFFTLSKEQFYSYFALQFDTLQKQWDTTIKTYSESIEILISELSEREKDIFRARELGNIADVSQTVLETIQEINKLIVLHNQKTQTLSDDQKAAREQLRYSEIAKFLSTIDYGNKISEIAALQTETINAKSIVDSVYSQIEKLNEKKRTLEAQSKDESKGAELVNNHLQHFFGHNELKLVAEGTVPNIRFKTIRDNENASNLSEGECSLISFCYFIAKMEDELNSEVDSQKLIIYIDDPISSLDSNHIFFMFSLIESVIAKPQKYCQLFISTHNLDFLKYLKQLTFPKYKSTTEEKKEKQDRKHFLIERNGKSKTTLKIAPKYLKDYITEFNYLFYQIYSCSTSDNQRISEDYQYNFGNNMRKFLEAYLFYKYPSDKLSFDERIKKFFNDDISYNLVRRVVNEYSHLEDRFERGLKPVDVDEIKQIAQKVLETIKSKDEDQYIALIESINNEIKSQ
jgi:wobble nucleotide-excising tRNase